MVKQELKDKRVIVSFFALDICRYIIYIYSLIVLIMFLLDIRKFVPPKVKSGIKGNKYKTKIKVLSDDYFIASYKTNTSNQYSSNNGFKEFSTKFPMYLSIDESVAEVLGFLQGEMSKTHRGPLTFVNLDVNIINKVLIWFKKEWSINFNDWNWYIKLNMLEPNPELSEIISEELIEHWMNSCPIEYSKKYNKTVSYTKNTKYPLKNMGSLIIERRNPLFVQTVQKLVEKFTASIVTQDVKIIRGFMRGIIAAEGCINDNDSKGIRRVFISAIKQYERNIYLNSVHKLGIEAHECKKINVIIISKKINLKKLLVQNMMSGHSEKNAKFNKMISKYVLF